MHFESPYFYAIGKYQRILVEQDALRSGSESRVDWKSKERDNLYSILNERVELSFHISEESKSSIPSKPRARNFKIEKRFQDFGKKIRNSSPNPSSLEKSLISHSILSLNR